jgi:hypothetical protein
MEVRITRFKENKVSMAQYVIKSCSRSAQTNSDLPTEADLDVDYPRPGKILRRHVGIDTKALSALAFREKGYPRCALLTADGANKVFLLTFEDGTEAIACCPFPEGYHRLQTTTEIAR